MLLNKLLNRHKLTLYAPMEGALLPLEHVADPVFSEKMMGDGIAIVPSHGDVVAPAKGEIVQIAPSKHAIGLRTEDGAELLIHVGLDTVELGGVPFHVHVNVGDQVDVGQRLLTADLEYIKQAGKDPVTPIVVTNGSDLTQTYTFTSEHVANAGKTVVARADG